MISCTALDEHNIVETPLIPTSRLIWLGSGGSEHKTMVSGTQEDPQSAISLMQLPDSSLAEVPGYLDPDLKELALTSIRAYVFNKMPIRNGDGSNIRLLEREEVFAYILPAVLGEITKPTFSSEWTLSKSLLNASITMNRRQRAQRNLLIGCNQTKCTDWISTVKPPDVFDQGQPMSKVTGFCKAAARDHGVTLGWIDTICINKESSAELDESIRSMYKWYRDAHITMTYLSETRHIDEMQRDSWFTRGWTLQELLAPAQTCFYGADWEILGRSNEDAVEKAITSATTITSHELFLCREGRADGIPLSRRMQMAAGRNVTREEDTSYSLMGIFGIDIPIAYGEGSERAFSRFYREILNTKKHVLDLFNHRRFAGADSIIPPSIDLYANRHSIFDDPYEPSGTSLSRYSLSKPIILTHLGARIPFLLAPALLTKLRPDNDYKPQGRFFGFQTMHFRLPDSGTSEYHFNMLDSRLYQDTPPVSPSVEANRQHALVSIMGILNFGIDSDGNIIIPDNCFALSFQGRGLNLGKIGPTDSLRIEGGSAKVFRLRSTSNTTPVHKDELATHGLQFITLYV